MASVAEDFTGFPQRSLALLRKLPDCDKAAFARMRQAYEETIDAPARALVVELGRYLAEHVSPGLRALPKVNGSLSPIHRDIRFSKDKTLYKDHVLINFWEGANKKTAPTLRVRLHPDGIGFGVGAAFGPDELKRWRRAIDAEATGAVLVKALRRLEKATGGSVVGRELKRVPAPYSPDHPRAELLCHKWLQLRWQEPVPPSYSSRGFSKWCARRLEKMSPLHYWLRDYL